jgi:hypothetical protein
MTLFDNLLTVFILTVLALIIYLKVTNKTLVEFFREIREILADTREEVITK